MVSDFSNYLVHPIVAHPVFSRGAYNLIPDTVHVKVKKILSRTQQKQARGARRNYGNRLELWLYGSQGKLSAHLQFSLNNWYTLS